LQLLLLLVPEAEGAVVEVEAAAAVDSITSPGRSSSSGRAGRSAESRTTRNATTQVNTLESIHPSTHNIFVLLTFSPATRLTLLHNCAAVSQLYGLINQPDLESSLLRMGGLVAMDRVQISFSVVENNIFIAKI
jgi:hypothetical protein